MIPENDNPEDATAALHALMPLARTLGMTVLRYTSEQVCAQLAWSEELCTAGNVLHGGVLMALADSTGAACAFLNLPDGAVGTTTIESKTNFVRAVHAGSVTACSTPVHIGSTLIVVHTEIYDDRERLAAVVTQSQLVLAR